MPEHKPWQHSHNTFDTVTRGNFTLTNKLSSNHNAGLHAEAVIDPDVAPRAVAYEALHNSFHLEFATHTQLEGEVKSTTQTVNEMFAAFPKDYLRPWHRTITGVYDEGSDGYVRLFPKARKPFYKGTFVNRVVALDAYDLALTSETNLDLIDLRALVIEYIADLKAIIQKQKDAQEKLKASSARLEPKRVACMKLMFSNLGFFIEKYPDSPKDIERTFDLTSVRRYALAAEVISNEVVVSIAAGHQKEAGISLTPTMKLLFKNPTDLPIIIFLSGSNVENQEVPDTHYELAPHSEEELFVAQIGNPQYRYMYLLNENSTVDAQVSIMILN